MGKVIAKKLREKLLKEVQGRASSKEVKRLKKEIEKVEKK
jgi:hypothetical protein